MPWPFLDDGGDQWMCMYKILMVGLVGVYLHDKGTFFYYTNKIAFWSRNRIDTLQYALNCDRHEKFWSHITLRCTFYLTRMALCKKYCRGVDLHTFIFRLDTLSLRLLVDNQQMCHWQKTESTPWSTPIVYTGLIHSSCQYLFDSEKRFRYRYVWMPGQSIQASKSINGDEQYVSSIAN